MATADRVTLADLLKRSNQPLERGIVRAYLEQSPYLNNWPIDTTGALSGKGRRRATAPAGAGNRLINEAFTSAVTHTEQYQWGLSIYGTYVDIDTMLLSEPGGVEEQSEQVSAQTQGLAQQIANDLINGDEAVNPKAFSGLKSIMSTLPARQTIDGAGLDLDSAADRATNGRALLSLIETAIQRVKQGTGQNPGLILCGDDMQIILGDVARALTGAGWWNTTKDGDRTVTTLFGIPLEPTGFNQAGNQIIAADHDGTYTSMYFLRLGQDYCHLKQKAKLMVGKPQLLDDQVTSRIKIEWALAPFVKNDFAVCRLKGLDITV